MTDSAPLEPTFPLISFDQEGAHVVSPYVAEKLANKSISPSMITGLEGCHARWLADSFVMEHLVPEEPDNAGRRGSLFHAVMEDLFDLPPEERTHAAVKRIVKERLTTGEYADLGRIPEAVKWLREAINNYYNMGGDPQKVEIAELERTKTKKDGTTFVKKEKGIEIFVKGKIGNARRATLGFIDQVIVDPTRDDGSVIVQDWKSGKKAKEYKEKNKGEDGLAEQRQQIIYSILLRKEGFKVSGARLIFPVPRKVVTVQLDNERLFNRVIKDVEATDEKLDVLIETNTFGLKPSFLCSYCPLAKACPQAKLMPYDGPAAAYASQPELDVLAKGIEFH